MSALLVPKIITKTSRTKGGIIFTIIPRAVEFARLNFFIVLELKQQQEQQNRWQIRSNYEYEALMSE